MEPLVTKSTELVEQIKTLIDPVLGREGYELIDVEYVSDRGRQVLRIYIDTIPPGTAERAIGVDDCSNVSRVVSDLLDVEDVVPGQYHLEVSSPGLFRPLTKPEHFDRSIGARVKVKTFERVGDRKVFTGILTKHEGGLLSIHIDGVERQLELRQVAKANLEPDLSRGGPA
ncbi:MAG: ribosome maturation factor RimP [Deltaproteobacteria bacterium]|nr:ribosome maturation factor RimP [Deltaproteobacteria bacterium]